MKHCLIASCIYINTTRNTGEMRIVSNHSGRVIGYPVFVHPLAAVCDLRVCIVQVSFFNVKMQIETITNNMMQLISRSE